MNEIRNKPPALMAMEVIRQLGSVALVGDRMEIFARGFNAGVERQLAVEKKRASAQSLLIKSQEKQLTEFGKQKDSWMEAVSTLDSERKANDVLTRQLAERGEAVEAWEKQGTFFCPICSHPVSIPALEAHTAPQVPEGWNLVPTTPTEEMMREMVDGFIAVNGDNRTEFNRAYRAMLAAAPGVKL